MEIEAYINISKKREGVGSPGSQEVVDYMQRVARPMRWQLLENFSTDAGVFAERLVLLKETSEKRGVSFSMPELCATIISDLLTRQSIEASVMKLEQGNKPSLRFFADFAMGAETTLAPISTAHSEIAGEEEEHILKVMDVKQNEKKEQMISDDVEYYLNLKSITKQFAELMIEDKSGFLLVDKIVDGIEKEELRLPRCVAKDYFLAGAQLARDLYKKACGIANDLYPAQKSP